MLSSIQIIPVFLGGVLAYLPLKLITLFLGQQEHILLACLFAGVIFTIISLASGRALNYFYIPAYRDVEPGKYWFLTGNYLGFFLWSSLLLLANPLDTEVNYAEIINNEFTISSEGSQFIYELDKNATTLSGVAAMTGFNQGIDDGGVLLTLHFLSHESGQKFDETYGKSGRCPAHFLTRMPSESFSWRPINKLKKKYCPGTFRITERVTHGRISLLMGDVLSVWLAANRAKSFFRCRTHPFGTAALLLLTS